MTGKRKPLQTQLRRSISEQLRDSTARAWDRLWKNVRERRLAGRCPQDSGLRGGWRRRGPRRPPGPPSAAALGSRHRFSEAGVGWRRLLAPPSLDRVGAPTLTALSLCARWTWWWVWAPPRAR